MRLLFLLCFAACASDVHVQYPAAPDDPTGKLIILFTQPASDVSIAVNGVLVAEDEHTQRVTIERAPIGTVDVTVAANGADKELRVWVSSEHATTVPIGMPDSSTSFVKTLFGTLVTIVAYSLLR